MENFLISTKMSIILILTRIATLLRKITESITIPCPVKTNGSFLRPPYPASSSKLKVANYDFKFEYFSFVSWNRNLFGNLEILCFAASFNPFFSTWYSIAKSLSIITCWLRITYIILFISDSADSLLISWVSLFTINYFFFIICSHT